VVTEWHRYLAQAGRGRGHRGAAAGLWEPSLTAFEARPRWLDGIMRVDVFDLAEGC